MLQMLQMLIYNFTVMLPNLFNIRLRYITITFPELRYRHIIMLIWKCYF